jgi:hypothetical protein
VIHVVHGLLFFALFAVLAWVSAKALVHRNRTAPERPLIAAHGPDRVAGAADNLALADEIAVRHPMRHRPPVAAAGPGWREAELPALDPVTENRLHTECRAYLAAAP